jgi:hypothetical protein
MAEAPQVPADYAVGCAVRVRSLKGEVSARWRRQGAVGDHRLRRVSAPRARRVSAPARPLTPPPPPPPQELAGEVLAYDAVDGAVLLQRPGSSPFHTHLSVVKLAALGEVLESRQPAGPPPPPPAVDEARTQDRLERAMRAAEVDAAKLGVGVTREAQLVFDAMSKTLPCRWDGQRILVLEEVRGGRPPRALVANLFSRPLCRPPLQIAIASPYGPDDCTSVHAEDDVAAMDRVKKVVRAAAARLAARGRVPCAVAHRRPAPPSRAAHRGAEQDLRRRRRRMRALVKWAGNGGGGPETCEQGEAARQSATSRHTNPRENVSLAYKGQLAACSASSWGQHDACRRLASAHCCGGRGGHGAAARRRAPCGA